jgi:hypothetical protein
MRLGSVVEERVQVLLHIKDIDCCYPHRSYGGCWQVSNRGNNRGAR